MAEPLATKYRPQTLDEICGQESIVKILNRQISLNEIKNTYLFCGPSGCGKTTAARAFASAINNNIGSPIEIDAASNNGVDNVRQIVKTSNERAIDCKYKVYILDECHSLTTQSWQAFLKCIEEPPPFTIFIFCTTNPQKIPDTILNRVLRFNFSRRPSNKIKERLNFICKQEHFTNYDDACDYISRISKNQMRDAISLLDKCASYDSDLNIENVLSAIGNFSYDIYFNLINSIIDGNLETTIQILTDIYNSGNDMIYFVDNFLAFCLDVSKYCIFNSIEITKLPQNLIEQLKNCTNFDNANKYYLYIIDNLLELKQLIKQDIDAKSTIEVKFLQLCRCI